MRFGCIAFLLLFLAACGSGSVNETSAEDDSAESASEVADEAETAEADFEFDSPIGDFLGVDYSDFDSEESQARFAEQQREGEEKVAACMRELGWEYTPNIQDSSTMFVGGEEDLEYGSAEWVEKYALGITTQRYSQTAVGPDLVGYNDEGFDAVDDGYVDPNSDYLEALSESEQQAYYQDLDGEWPEFDETLTEAEQEELWNNFEPSGCRAEGYDMFGGVEQEFYETFSDELDSLYERAAADPRVVAEGNKIVECLAEEGHTFDADTQLFEQLYEMFESELESIDGPQDTIFEDPFEGLDFESMTEEEINEILSTFEQEQLSDEQLATLAEVQQKEFDLADDLLSCDPNFMQSGGQGPVFFEVMAEYEQQFLDDNAAALAQFEGTGSQ